MGHSVLIETPFASATQTAKILGVSKSRKKQLSEMLNLKRFRSKDRFHVVGTGSTKKCKAASGATWGITSKRAAKSKKVNTKRRLLSKRNASKKTHS